MEEPLGSPGAVGDLGVPAIDFDMVREDLEVGDPKLTEVCRRIVLAEVAGRGTGLVGLSRGTFPSI